MDIHAGGVAPPLIVDIVDNVYKLSRGLSTVLLWGWGGRGQRRGTPLHGTLAVTPITVTHAVMPISVTPAVMPITVTPITVTPLKKDVF